METQKELKDREGFDWLESTELVINKRKFLLNCMKSSPFHKIKTRTTTFVLLRVIKNCKQPNLKCLFFIDYFTIFTTFFYTGWYMKFIVQNKTCFIDLEQTGRPRIPYIVKHVDAF